MDLDILFSDHHLARSSLEELGSVVRILCRATDDRELRFAAFLRYMTQNHPQFLEVRFTPEGERRIEMLLEGLDLPDVTIRRPPESRGRSSRAPDEPDHWEPGPPGGNGSEKPICKSQ